MQTIYLFFIIEGIFTILLFYFLTKLFKNLVYFFYSSKHRISQESIDSFLALPTVWFFSSKELGDSLLHTRKKRRKYRLNIFAYFINILVFLALPHTIILLSGIRDSNLQALIFGGYGLIITIVGTVIVVYSAEKIRHI